VFASTRALQSQSSESNGSYNWAVPRYDIWMKRVSAEKTCCLSPLAYSILVPWNIPLTMKTLLFDTQNKIIPILGLCRCNYLVRSSCGQIRRLSVSSRSSACQSAPMRLTSCAAQSDERWLTLTWCGAAKIIPKATSLSPACATPFLILVCSPLALVSSKQDISYRFDNGNLS
jgi:hypothetical protein